MAGSPSCDPDNSIKALNGQTLEIPRRWKYRAYLMSVSMLLQSVFISKVMEGGAAARDGRLRAGDQIISVCFHSVFFILCSRHIFYTASQKNQSPNLCYNFIINVLNVSQSTIAKHSKWDGSLMPHYHKFSISVFVNYLKKIKINHYLVNFKKITGLIFLNRGV